jgi:hypothetical protein
VSCKLLIVWKKRQGDSGKKSRKVSSLHTLGIGIAPPVLFGNVTMRLLSERIQENVVLTGKRSSVSQIPSSGQSSWLQIHGSEYHSTRCQIFRVLGLERGPLSLVSTIWELLGRSSVSGLENREYGHRNPSRWPRGTIYPKNLALTSSTSSVRSVGIVRSRTQASESSFSFSLRQAWWWWIWRIT